MPSPRFKHLYETYPSTHSGRSNHESEGRVVRRDLAPWLSPTARADQLILDLGCGQGELVAHLIELGYSGSVGVDISAEQVSLAHAAGVYSVEHDDYRHYVLTQRWNAIFAVDFIEHLDHEQVLELFELVRDALAPGGTFICRLPNNGSPFAGRYQYGDFTHLTALTPRSFGQIARAAGFSDPVTLPCPPLRHGLKSTLQVMVWKLVEAGFKVALAAEVGARHEIVTQNFYGIVTVD